ncbi:MAG: EAL domain-containing protein [Chloroflexi bacterium]|nr:EAL domain-containing protein [Chloroflexota bacterium]
MTLEVSPAAAPLAPHRLPPPVAGQANVVSSARHESQSEQALLEHALILACTAVGMGTAFVARDNADGACRRVAAVHRQPGGPTLIVGQALVCRPAAAGSPGSGSRGAGDPGSGRGAATDAWLLALPGVAAGLTVPILLADGTAHGVLGAVDSRPRAIAREDRATLAEAALVVAALLDQESIKRRHDLVLRSAGEGIVGLDRQGVITFVSTMAARTLGYQPADLIGRDHHALFHHSGSHGEPLSEADCPILAAIRSGNGHREADAVFWRRTGRAVPVEYVCTPMPDAVNADAALLLFKDVTESRAFEEEMLRQAYHDPLTALPNRNLFMERLEHHLQENQRASDGMAVLFLDLDRFKNINDSLGHGAGDELLIGVAQRVAACIRQDDVVARFGGDEFAVMLTGVRHSADAVLVAEKLLADIQEPFVLDGHEAYVGTSIGIAVAGPHSEAGALIRDADVALHRAKLGGKGRCVVFEETMPAFSVERLSLEADLRRALERRELRLYYQPVLDLGTEKIVGAEALVRWEHPKHGLVSPSDFIPMAEETGLILPIGKWVLEEACRQATIWRRKYADHADFTMAVNLSARQFQQPDLVEQVRAALERADFAPELLRLEITESILMEDVDATQAQLLALRGLGVKLAIDDFGTGYSSLSYIQRFPVDTLKIDRSFVMGLSEDARNPSIVQAAASLAHALGMDVTAEGIETVDQLRSLQGLSCDHGQGYLFARPLSSEAIDSLLTNGIPRDR